MFWKLMTRKSYDFQSFKTLSLSFFNLILICLHKLEQRSENNHNISYQTKEVKEACARWFNEQGDVVARWECLSNEWLGGSRREADILYRYLLVVNRLKCCRLKLFISVILLSSRRWYPEKDDKHHTCGASSDVMRVLQNCHKILPPKSQNMPSCSLPAWLIGKKHRWRSYRKQNKHAFPSIVGKRYTKQNFNVTILVTLMCFSLH